MDTLEVEDGELGAGVVPSLDAILSIPVTVQVVLGETSMPVAKLMKLGRGAVITLDQKVGAPCQRALQRTGRRTRRSRRG